MDIINHTPPAAEQAQRTDTIKAKTIEKRRLRHHQTAA
jgi:hypothetical protein